MGDSATEARLGTHPGVAPYASSAELLTDEFRRIDLLVRAATVAWRDQIAASKPEHTWGMLHVSDAEVSRYLEAPFTAASTLSDALAAEHAILIEQSRSLESSIQERVAATDGRAALSLCWLCAAMRLNAMERDVLLVCALSAVDPRYRRLFGYLQDDASRGAPSVELVLDILAPLLPSRGEGRAVFAPDGALRRRGLLNVPAEGTRPFHLRSAEIDERIVQHLLDADGLPDELASVATAVDQGPDWEDLEVTDETLDSLRGATDAWLEALGSGWEFPTVVLRGPRGSQRELAARALVRAVGLPTLRVDARHSAADRETFRRLVRVAVREALLRHAVLFWIEAQPDEARVEVFFEELREEPVPVVIVTERSALGSPGHTMLAIEFAPADYDLRRRAWLRQLRSLPLAADAGDTVRLAQLLAGAFRLRLDGIHDAIAGARSTLLLRPVDQRRLTVADLYECCRHQSTSRMSGMAQRIEPRTELTFDDLILPPTNRRQLDDLRLRIQNMHRVLHEIGLERRIPMARGLCTLFSGSSGTGKTLAARLLAAEQKVDLYRIDLAAIVSKYVGETEKNLERLFQEAENANAILFFDEADALFGKRGEIKEARDRWANLEVDYLLQRIEDYEGVVILATNLRQNIDEAFLRRMHSIVEFPAPDERARERIWLGLFPDTLRRPPDKAIARLARQFALPGGSIRNVVIDAAFRAVADAGAEDEPVIELKHLGGALGRELQKLGHPVTRGDFGAELYEFAAAEVLGPH